MTDDLLIREAVRSARPPACGAPLVGHPLTDPTPAPAAKQRVPTRPRNACDAQGASKVLVEVREGARGAYGLGRKAPMRFAEFVRRVVGGDAGLYLSAQQVKSGCPRAGPAATRGLEARGLARGGPPCCSGTGLVDLHPPLWVIGPVGARP
jgi:hypothetical protein